MYHLYKYFVPLERAEDFEDTLSEVSEAFKVVWDKVGVTEEAKFHGRWFQIAVYQVAYDGVSKERWHGFFRSLAEGYWEMLEREMFSSYWLYMRMVPGDRLWKSLS